MELGSRCAKTSSSSASSLHIFGNVGSNDYIRVQVSKCSLELCLVNPVRGQKFLHQWMYESFFCEEKLSENLHIWQVVIVKKPVDSFS